MLQTVYVKSAIKNVEVLKHPRERVRRVRPELWAKNAWILHQDNAPVHIALLTRRFSAKYKIIIIEHPLYLLD